MFMALAWSAGMALIVLLSRQTSLAQRVAGLSGLLKSEFGILVFPAAMLLLPKALGWLAFAVFSLRIAFEAVRVWRSSRSQVLSTLAFIAMPLLPLVAMGAAFSASETAATLLLALLYVEVFDSLALLGGTLFGRRLVWPSLSPRKSWEGYGFGVAGLIGAAALTLLFNMASPWQVTLTALCTVVFAPVGDLFASWSKRLAGAKDYPVLVAGQGGALDIYDAWITVAPVTVLVLHIALG